MKKYRKLVPIQVESKDWDMAYAQLTVEDQAMDHVPEDALMRSVVRQLAIGLGEQLINHYGVERELDHETGATLFRVKAPFGPYDIEEMWDGGRYD